MQKYDEAPRHAAEASNRAARIVNDNVGVLRAPLAAARAAAAGAARGARPQAGAPADDELPSLIDRVSDIVDLDEDPVLRNLLITQCYHDLSEGLGRVLGGESANWCTFATWASKTAGRFIRRDEIPAELRNLLAPKDAAPESGLSSLGIKLFGGSRRDERLLDLPGRVLDDVASLIAQGNLKVFAELGPVFARMIDIYEGCTRPSDERLEALLEPLRIGPSTQGGQSLLRSALTHYHKALLADSADAKVELTLFGNARIGLHEQLRLQPFIAGSLNAPVRCVLRMFGGQADLLPEALQSAVLEGLVRPAVEKIEALWREVATKQMMVLKLPDRALDLGEDLPCVPGQPLHPEYLRTIEDPELHALLAEYGAHDETAKGSGAEDWSSLRSRMGYILELFRSRQCDVILRQQPFTRAQRADMIAGNMPSDRDL